jgi:formylglycine-generating enzyme required for sulfatase activity
MQRYPVNNAAFLEFVKAGGYHDRNFWSDADWAWRAEAGIEHPAFWRKAGSKWLWRAMFTEVPLPLSWPVFVSHAEAAAYARYAGKQLPSESEWHRAALGTPEEGQRRFPWGEEEPRSDQHGVFGAAYDPAPVQAHPGGQSAFGVHGLMGNGWNWTRTVFAPFPDFTPQPFYTGYSADFFDGRHFVLKGASPSTDVGLVRSSFRNWFQPHYPYTYASFRCVEPS